MASRSLSLRHLLVPYWRPLAVAFSAMLVESAMNLLEPWPLKVIFDYVLGSKHRPDWIGALVTNGSNRMVLLDAAALAVVAIAAIGAAASYADKYFSALAGKRIGFDLRHMLYHHVQRQSLLFYQRQRTGDMVVRLTSDIDAAEDFISTAVLSMLFDALTLVGMLSVMFYLDWRFSLIGLTIAPPLFFVVYRYTKRIKTAARAVKKKESDLASVVQESISSARTVKAFAREEFEEGRLDRESRETVDVTLQARRLKARLSTIVDLAIALGTALVLVVGVRWVIGGWLTAGDLLVFVLYLDKMYKPMKDFSKMSDTVSKASVSLDRIGDVLSVEMQVVERPGAEAAPPFAGEIIFDHVQFGYTPGQPVLKDVTFSVAAGQRAALVGMTGSGKSTLIGLIPRLYDVGGGSIRIDGRDITTYTLESLRRQISIVPQDTLLFHTTIADNIGYGRPEATPEETTLAARLANADEFIRKMPDGYATVIGERGETLSGGQRQRIAIARAIVRNAPILLLDEPSAALDPQSEALILDGLAHLMQGRTSLTIAHRLATVRNADVIFVLHDGVIAEHGNHDELLAMNGLYARLFRLQFGPDAGRAAVPIPAAYLVH